MSYSYASLLITTPQAAEASPCVRSITGDLNDGSESVGLFYQADVSFTGVGQFTGVTIQSQLRFVNIQVPQGATITSATLTISDQATFDDLNPPSGLWYGYDVDHAMPMEDGGVIPSTASKTTAATPFIPSNSLTPVSVDHDVTSVVQEIINRVGWQRGNALSILVMDNGSPDGYADLWAAYEAPVGPLPQLEIVWTTGGGGGTAVPVFYYHMQMQGMA